ncbi:hypothetical protein O181_017632 [Austropuccinia psidii MF-1]|uniref:Uncharacterized protein n=1 Tax=Austropuccinia psidii MF-1 TaxID=1389203 RepID=A0A9Q3C7Z2_9BASI|nr:hypothetical protein [Austropuccinia psidii MF-1]
MAHSPWDPSSPFGLNLMGQKGGKGAFHRPQGQVGSKPQVCPPEPILAQISTIPKMAKNHILDNFNPWPLETTRGHQLRSSKASPQFRGRTLLHQCTPYQMIQEGCIYGIIYHYAPILLRNPMEMLSGPNYVFTIQVPKSITHFKGGLFSHSVLQSLAGTQRPFEDPNHLALQELGCIFFSRVFQG